jgi:uncharacterized protein YkwD
MKFQLLFCIFFCSAGAVISQSRISTTGSRINSEQAAAMLSHHNKVRKEVGSTPLVWSQELAAYAQRWAEYLANENGCEMRHRGESDREGKQFGENIFWGSDKNVYQPSNASLSWYSEIEDYKYGPLTEKNWYKTGHYTQMVWKNTLRMGAGVAYCPSGALIVVANYDPPGNYLGQTPY